MVQEQATFEFKNVTGTIAGFRSPDYAQGISVGGYHLHFITSDRTGGGHVLDLMSEDATLAIDHSSGLHVELPETAAFLYEFRTFLTGQQNSLDWPCYLWVK